MGRSVAFAVLLLAGPLAAQSRFHAEGLSVFDMRPAMLSEVTALLDMKMEGGGMPAMEIKMRTSLKRIDAPPPKPVAVPKTGG